MSHARSRSELKKATPKQIRFVQEYLVDLNATQAALRAGYRSRAPGQMGYENLKKPEIVEAIRGAFIQRERRTEVTQDKVVEKLWEIVLRSMQTIPVVDGRGDPVGAYTYHPAAATRALELLGRHLGMWRPIGTEDDPLTVQLRTVQEFDFSQLTDEELREVASQLRGSGRTPAGGGGRRDGGQA